MFLQNSNPSEKKTILSRLFLVGCLFLCKIIKQTDRI